MMKNGANVGFNNVIINKVKIKKMKYVIMYDIYDIITHEYILRSYFS